MSSKAKKPTTREAMYQLLSSIEKELPLFKRDARLCQKTCNGCPKKLMQYIENEFDNWHYELKEGVHPSLADLYKLAKTAKKIHSALVKNGII